MIVKELNIGRRLTSKESMQMLDNEISQAEERTSKLVRELDNLQIIGVDVSLLPDQSSVVYISNNKAGKTTYESRLRKSI